MQGELAQCAAARVEQPGRVRTEAALSARGAHCTALSAHCALSAWHSRRAAKLRAHVGCWRRVWSRIGGVRDRRLELLDLPDAADAASWSAKLCTIVSYEYACGGLFYSHD